MAEAAAFFAVVATLATSSSDAVSTGAIDAAVRAAYEDYFGPPPLDRDAAERHHFAELVRTCGTDAVCLAAKLAAARVSLAMLVTADLEVQPPLASMVLFDVDRAVEVGKTIVELPGTDDRAASGVIRAGAERLFDRAKLEVAGHVAFSIAPSDARVELLDAVPRVVTGELKLRPGHYRAQVSREGHLPQVIDFEVKGHARADVNVELEAEASLLGSPWIWIGAGAVIAGAVTIGAIVATGSGDRCFCLEGQNGACDSARCD